MGPKCPAAIGRPFAITVRALIRGAPPVIDRDLPGLGRALAHACQRRLTAWRAYGPAKMWARIPGLCGSFYKIIKHGYKNTARRIGHRP